MSATSELPTATRSASGTYTVEWGSIYSTRYRALFRLAGSAAILQHVRWVRQRQVGSTTSGLDPDPDLVDVPDRELRRLRNRGFRPVEGGGSR